MVRKQDLSTPASQKRSPKAQLLPTFGDCWWKKQVCAPLGFRIQRFVFKFIGITLPLPFVCFILVWPLVWYRSTLGWSSRPWGPWLLHCVAVLPDPVASFLGMLYSLGLTGSCLAANRVVANNSQSGSVSWTKDEGCSGAPFLLVTISNICRYWLYSSSLNFFNLCSNRAITSFEEVLRLAQSRFAHPVCLRW